MLNTVIAANAQLARLPVAMCSLQHASNKETVKRVLYFRNGGYFLFYEFLTDSLLPLYAFHIQIVG
jgi:hypothetical protein